MCKINIYVRTDVRTKEGRKVPNGKMASQSAHALMGLFLSLFNKDNRKLTLMEKNKTLANHFLNNSFELNVIPISSEKEILELFNENKEESFMVTDQGLTSFNEPTITTLAVAPKGTILSDDIRCRREDLKGYNSKQVIVINKDKIKDKWDMFHSVSMCSITFLIDLLNKSENKDSITLDNDGLNNWINGLFAKITVKPSVLTFEDALLKLEKAKSDNIYTSVFTKNDEIKCISFGADSIEKIDFYTKEGFSLA